MEKMKSYAEIKTALHALHEKENVLQNELKQLQDTRRTTAHNLLNTKGKNPEAYEALKQRAEEEAAIRTEQKTLEMEKTMLQHNARLAFFHEVMPQILEILRPFIGKPYGEKTAEKINAISLETCGRRLRIIRSYEWAEISISTPEKYDEQITVCSITDARILIDNKIQKVTMEDLHLKNEKTMEYIYDIPAAIANIRALRAAVTEKMTELKEAMKAYNEAVPVYYWQEDPVYCKYISPVD